MFGEREKKPRRSAVLEGPAPSGPARENSSRLAEDKRIHGVVIGHLVQLGDDGTVLVDYKGNPAGRPVSAVGTTRVTEEDIGKELALVFEEGDPARPIYIGPIVSPDEMRREHESREKRSLQVQLDDERLTLSAEREIVLKCGKASITLTRAGKVLIRGAYLLSRSSGVHRIKGGSVQIN